MRKFFRRIVVTNDRWQQHEHSRPQRERRSKVEMNRPEGTGDPGGGDHSEIFLQRKVREQLAPQWAQDNVRFMSFEVEPCVVWALRVSPPFLAKLIED